MYTNSHANATSQGQRPMYVYIVDMCVCMYKRAISQMTRNNVQKTSSHKKAIKQP